MAKTSAKWRRSRLQAAIEFLSTYSWMILVVIAVLGVLFALGTFNPPVPQVCVPQAGYLCQLLALNTTGNMTVYLGQGASSASNIVIIGLACTPNAITPTSFTQPLATNASISTGSRQEQLFECPVSGGVGTIFGGYLWIEYNSISSSLTSYVQQVGSFTAKISTASVLAPPPGVTLSVTPNDLNTVVPTVVYFSSSCTSGRCVGPSNIVDYGTSSCSSTPPAGLSKCNFPDISKMSTPCVVSQSGTTETAVTNTIWTTAPSTVQNLCSYSGNVESATVVLAFFDSCTVGVNTITYNSYGSIYVTNSAYVSYNAIGGAGGGSGDPGGSGTFSNGNFAVTPGETLTAYVGGGGGGSSGYGSGGGGGSGYYGGGGGGYYLYTYYLDVGGGGGGGGSTAILLNGAVAACAPGGQGAWSSVDTIITNTEGYGGTCAGGGAGGFGYSATGMQYTGGSNGAQFAGGGAAGGGSGGSGGNGGVSGAAEGGGGGGYGGGGGGGWGVTSGSESGTPDNGGNGGSNGNNGQVGSGTYGGRYGYGSLTNICVGYSGAGAPCGSYSWAGGNGGIVILTWPGQACPI